MNIEKIFSKWGEKHFYKVYLLLKDKISVV